MPRSPELQTVLDFCLQHADAAPLARRVLLYRGLAEFCGDAKESRGFLQLAADLEAADRRCREFHFLFTQGGSK